MQIYNNLSAAFSTRPTVLTIGNFDGIHRGHQALLADLLHIARAHQAVGGMITFDPHPLVVLRPQQPLFLLTTPAERLHIAAQHGLELGIIQPFTPSFAAQEPADFMAALQQRLNLAVLVVGPDFALGRNRSGNLDVLTELGHTLGYRIHVIDPYEGRVHPVRSSTIRSLLSQGDVAAAADLLGRPYHATGLVVQGDQRGRQIGIPTANVRLPADKLWPADGVYATRTTLHGWPAPQVYNSVTNLGIRPTVGGTEHRFETHLLDFPQAGGSDNLYGHEVTVEFVARLRGEQRFHGLDALVAQIHADIAQARALLPHPHLAAQPFFLAR
jgi:riboflavin kinase/FMN adenylyltransferase